MQLQIDLLKTFVALVDSGSFTRAGQMVNRTQSAVSMQIKRLEEVIGRPLIVRSGKSFTLSNTGKTLLKYARRILKEHDDAVSWITRPVLSGRIRFGAPELCTSHFLPQILSRFVAAHADVRVDVSCDASEEIKRGVDNGALDVGLCLEITEGGEIMHREPLVWIASPDYLLRQRELISLIVYSHECVFQQWAVEGLEKAGSRYRLAYVSPSIAGVLAAVRAGLGITPIGLSTAPNDLRIIGPEEKLPVLPVATVSLHRGRSGHAGLVDCFAEHIRNCFRRLGAGDRAFIANFIS